MKVQKILLFLLVLTVSTTMAQLTNGAKTLMHTQTATTFEKGKLGMFTNMDFFTKAGDFIGQSKPIDFKTVNYWLVAGNAIFTYGIMDHLDATLGIRVYQDTHYTNEFNLPDDLFLTLRAGSFVFGQQHFQAGFLTSFRIPTGEVHNYPFTEYASGALEYGFLAAFSFYEDQYLPQRSLNIHFNMGFWNHNEAGKTIYTYQHFFHTHQKGDKLIATKSSKEFRMALAAVIPSPMFDFRAELSGMLYITEPDNFVYSAEEWAYFSPSIRYKPVDWLSLDIGADFRLSPGDRQNTTADIPDISKSIDMPSSYPAWKVYMGANLSLNLLGKGQRTIRDYETRQRQEETRLIESILNEKQKAKKAEKEVENLRKVRKEAEKEIEDLKKLLED